MPSSFMADLSAIGAEAITAKKSTSRANNTEMKMEDFLKLMVVQLQSQTIDDTADTGEMLNQLVQMQMVTALSNMTDASIMSYASSLVGKEVTIGYTDKENNFHQEVLNVTGTGVYNGQQVIFCDDGNMYQLNQIMGVGRIPELKEDEETEEDEDAPGAGTPGAEEPKGELQDRLEDYNQLISSIKDGSFDPDSTDSAGEASDVGAVQAAESSSEAETETGNRTFDPFENGLLDGMLDNRSPAGEAYDGTQGADTYAAE